MYIFFDTFIRRCLSVLNILALFLAGPAAFVVTQPLAAQQSEPQPAKLGPSDLDNVVARVALYPDPLLAQVMAAATFAEQIPAATQWAAQHKNLKGDALTQAMDSANLGFDPSVQALLAFPSVLDMMNKDQAWTEKLGDATLVQRGDVMDAVQRMRKRAYDAGNLKTSQQITVVQSSPQVIEIQPPSPTVIYVPTYSPQTVYSPPPPSGPSTGAVVAAAAIGFTLGVALSSAYCNSYWGYHGGFGWSSHTVVIHNSAWGRTWANHGAYVHTWGGVNHGFYARPTAYVNTNAYVRHNVNVNVNRNVNVNTNVNLNRNVNVNQNANINRNANVNQNVNRNAYANQARGYGAQSTARASTFSGVQNGRREQIAASRGRSSRARR